MLEKNKRGQMKMSFGMIFSIILIVIFIAFAFFAIQKFLGLQDSVKLKQFSENLQNDVDSAWKSTKYSQDKSYSLPDKVEEVCFRNDDKNLLLRGETFIEQGNIEHIDIEKMTADGDFCIPNTDGKVEMFLSKDFGENLVTVENVG
jgi:hypothetical protein